LWLCLAGSLLLRVALPRGALGGRRFLLVLAPTWWLSSFASLRGVRTCAVGCWCWSCQAMGGAWDLGLVALRLVAARGMVACNLFLLAFSRPEPSPVFPRYPWAGYSELGDLSLHWLVLHARVLGCACARLPLLSLLSSLFSLLAAACFACLWLFAQGASWRRTGSTRLKSNALQWTSSATGSIRARSATMPAAWPPASALPTRVFPRGWCFGGDLSGRVQNALS